MLDGKRFLPLTGIPISNMDCSKIKFADCEPVPLAVAILMVKSLAMVSIVFSPEVVGLTRPVLYRSEYTL